MNKRRSLITALTFLAVPILGFFQNFTTANGSFNSTVQVWNTIEITLTGTKTYTNGYTDTDVDAIFVGPNGTTIKRPAFWDGGNVWKVRFAPTIPGLWNYTTSATLVGANDPGLNSRGTISAITYDGSLAVYQHGFVKSQHGHNLAYQDDTPFWWMGYDIWTVEFGKLNQSNKAYWNPVPAHPNSQVYGSIDQAVTQGFNVIDYAFWSHWALDANYKPIPNQINVRQFDTVYDPILQYTASQGVTINLTVAFGEFDFQNADVLKRLGRYLVARYGSYPIVWNVSEPDLPVGIDVGGGAVPATSAQNLSDTLAYVSVLDSYHHPMGPWYFNTALPSTTPRPELYLNAPWISLIIHQCGNLVYDFGKQQISSYRFYYEKYPNIPMVEAGGCNYANIYATTTDDVSRRSAWRAAQAGSAGFGYGTQGVWNMQWDWTGPVNGGQGNVVPWFIGIDTPSSWHMTFLKAFYTALPWANMSPRYGRNSVQLSDSITDDLSQPLVRADAASTNVAVYFPAEVPPGTLTLLNGLANTTYAARWYNPRTGAYTLISNSMVPTQGTLLSPQKPDTGDWALLLQASLAPIQTGGSNSTSCKISQPNCANYPYYVGTFIDNYLNASSNPTECMQRASDYHAWCGNSSLQPTVATFAYGASVVQTTTVGSSCRISQTACTKFPNYVGTFIDNYLNASSNPTECMQRASDYHAWCGNSSTQPTIATYYSNGKFVKSISAP